MKRSIIRKLACAALGLTLIASMSITCFAADLSSGVAKTSDTSVNINKTLTVKNPDLSSVDGPGMSYSYSISSVEPSAANGGTTVTDSDQHTGTVHAGPESGVTLATSSVTFPIGTAVNASAQGAKNPKTFTATTDLTKFTAPGIYRYKITETPNPADPTTVGVTDTGDRDRFLDVYIENGPTGLVVAGYTLHDRYNNKTDGFNGGSTGSGQPFTGAAEYVTKNITLEVEVGGNMGDRNNQFPFAGTVKDNGRSFYVKKGEAPKAQASDLAQGSNTGTSLSTTLAHTEKYYISGLSQVATVDYTETNNTPDAYSVSITGGTPSEASQVAQGSQKTMGVTDVTDSEHVKFTNVLESVSPTGVAMRYGLPVILIALAAALLLMSKRQGSEQGI